MKGLRGPIPTRGILLTEYRLNGNLHDKIEIKIIKNLRWPSRVHHERAASLNTVSLKKTNKMVVTRLSLRCTRAWSDVTSLSIMTSRSAF